MAVVEFQKRASLHEVCREFTRRHQHDGLRRAPILTDLAEMVMPSQSMLRDGASSMGKRSGSPAPWFAPAAELLDEIERGAVQWDREARHTLGLECDARRDPHDALEGLPGMVTILSDRGHPLGIRLGAAGEASDGLIEADVRDWYRRARIVLGDLAPAERLPTVANPDHPSNGGRARLGPVCWSCAHTSCSRIAASSRRSLPWLCPSCNRDSLRRDPLSGLVVCLRSSCTDEDGRRPSWHVTTFDEGARNPWGDE